MLYYHNRHHPLKENLPAVNNLNCAISFFPSVPEQDDSSPSDNIIYLSVSLLLSALFS